MHKKKRTPGQLKANKEQTKHYLANTKPEEKATEFFKRAPYTMNKEVK